ncbi:Cell division ATP-binding protein FtsE [Anaerohalosphaera lusitana]|uniref:Cell division ATP-binding protein FtsE n=1 Tax=Anaerohalosphaera lusitana TaxID=1936003 RepID=A0A1U9NHH7_9BACT|nr:ATP-binding cassette domain-containing protein [Anaerohalosphaera lusitana]AQT66966.1 Cell division ATP-binding protein FtsE [Anaerohalosphaera lusitana]
MIELNAAKVYPWHGQISEQVCKVMRMFGISVGTMRERGLRYELDLAIEPGQICYLSGPSGSGKSTLLRELYEATTEQKVRLEDIELSETQTLVDCIAGETTLGKLLTLSKAGLSDVFTVLNKPANLSEGQKYRYRLACAIAGDSQVIFADEFCSNLDRIGAAVIAHNIARFARRSKKIFVLAGARDDFLADLRPDVIVKIELGGRTEVIRREREAGDGRADR